MCIGFYDLGRSSTAIQIVPFATTLAQRQSSLHDLDIDELSVVRSASASAVQPCELWLKLQLGASQSGLMLLAEERGWDDHMARAYTKSPSH